MAFTIKYGGEGYFVVINAAANIIVFLGCYCENNVCF
jgi:hypothetical protein